MDKWELQQYGWIVKEIDSLKKERNNILTTSVGAIKYTPVPAGKGCGDRTAATVAKLDDLSCTLNKQLKVYEAVRRDIEDAIASVDEVRLRHLLRLRYIERLTWEDIADQMNYDPSYVRSLHGVALEKIRKFKHK